MPRTHSHIHSDYYPVGISCPGGHSKNRAMPHWCWVSDLCPFGSIKPATSWVADSMGYRYAFNGKENDPTGMGGGGSTYDYGFRIYNAQIARFLSVDPLCWKYPMLSAYGFASNSPIMMIDIDGLEGIIIHMKFICNSNQYSTTIRVENNMNFGIYSISDRLHCYPGGGLREEKIQIPPSKSPTAISYSPPVIKSIFSSTSGTFGVEELASITINQFSQSLDDFTKRGSDKIGTSMDIETSAVYDFNYSGEAFSIAYQRIDQAIVKDFNTTSFITIQAIENSSYVQNLVNEYKTAGFEVILDMMPSSFSGIINVDDPMNPKGINLFLDATIDYTYSITRGNEMIREIRHEESGQSIKNEE